MTKAIRPCPMMKGDPCCLAAKEIEGIAAAEAGACGNPAVVLDNDSANRAVAKGRCPFMGE
ncbi:hypothetical protein [Desulfovibrio oxyclinae]|uniref:hypothetical protein n=1 Tax=Desulfovibrio oxyclinae TaxID=63560 RepID=UPI00039F45D6|nr:hypothetical protein [Desulfovibrio oxyclinae]